MAQLGPNRWSLTVLALGLVPSIWTAWLLWAAPIDGLTADRTALAARDFTALWSAGQAAAEHSLAVLADPAAFTASLRARFGPGIPSQIWPYPPTILLVARPLAELPLGLGFILYGAAGVLALWLALCLADLSLTARAAVAFSPAVATNVLAGQNGTIIAALLCSGLLLVDRRPLLAGLPLGALIIKPQFAILLPICLLAGGRWRTALSGCVSAWTLACVPAYVFGYQPWADFFWENRNTVPAYIGTTWQSEPAQLIFSSIFMAARSVGVGLSVGYLVQAVVTCGCAFCAWRLWRDPNRDATERMAATLPLILLAAPWVHTYDMPALTVSIVLVAFQARTSRRSLLAVAWLWPSLPPVTSFWPVLAVSCVTGVAWLAGSFRRPVYCAP